MISKEFFNSKGYSHLIHSVAADHVLDVLANSMWSTMMITGVFFMSFLIIFLSFKVGYSIGIESNETGPIEITFLFSFSGIRYINNHIRHHLFETPLLPRRRFSSLSLSWFSEFVKRASFSMNSRDIFSGENIQTLEKSRRNSTTVDSHGSRKSSISSKSKRLSVPHITSNQTNIPITTRTSYSASQTPLEKTNSAPKVISRRNTLPNISINSESSRVKNEIVGWDHKSTEKEQEKKELIEIVSPHFTNLNTIIEEEPTEDNLILNSGVIATQSNIFQPKINQKYDSESDALEECESLFGDIIDDSDTSSIIDKSDFVEETASNTEITKSNLSEPISILSRESNNFHDQYLDQSSPKSTSFRSSYLNYLPESIFGYSTGLNKNQSTINTNSAAGAPPGFTKRAISHDFSNSNPNNYYNSSTDNFINHQPLYARRRTETSHMFSDAAKSFFSFDFSSKSQISVNNIDELNATSPNRTSNSSPCLSDLQNTEDLFAPINWNFSNLEQNTSIRKSWDSIEEEDSTSFENSNSISTSNNGQSASFSSLFDGY